MKKLLYVAVMAALTSGAIACQNADDKLIGTWNTGINFPEGEGIEHLIFSHDSTFVLCDSIVYSGKDSGFEFSMRYFTEVGGRWNMCHDTVFLEFETQTFHFEPDMQSFRVAVADTSGIELPDSIVQKMGEDLAYHLGKNQEEHYASVAGIPQLLGRIVSVDDNCMKIENNGAVLLLYR